MLVPTARRGMHFVDGQVKEKPFTQLDLGTRMQKYIPPGVESARKIYNHRKRAHSPFCSVYCDYARVNAEKQGKGKFDGIIIKQP